jgi:ATP-dependent protease HslVU (ClpYQ) peptidase subunit
MTTIVWDGSTLAADGRTTAGNIVLTNTQGKIYMDEISKVRGSTVICYAIAGHADMENIIKLWLADGCPVTNDMEDANFEVLIITDDAAYMYSDANNDLYDVTHNYCSGSGADFAYSALAFKANACKAVKHACTLDIYSGGEGSFVNCRSKKPVLKRFTT